MLNKFAQYFDLWKYQIKKFKMVATAQAVADPSLEPPPRPIFKYPMKMAKNIQNYSFLWDI